MTDSSPKLTPVPKRTRFEVLRRDGYRCRYCGLAAVDGKGLTVDHVIPRSLGGSNHPLNLVAACIDCNAGKAASSPDAETVADVAADAVRWSAAMREVHAQSSAELHRHAEDVDAIRQEWMVSQLGELEPGWQVSVERFLGDGLSLADLLHFVPVVAARHLTPAARFRYFCGCCWNEIRSRRERSVSALTTDDAIPLFYDIGWRLRHASCGRSVAVDIDELSEGVAWNQTAASGWHDGGIYLEYDDPTARNDDLSALFEAFAGGHSGCSVVA